MIQSRNFYIRECLVVWESSERFADLQIQISAPEIYIYRNQYKSK